VISSDHLAPGAVGQIKASIDTTNRNGPLIKHVTIHSKDRTNPVLSLSMTLDVVQK
jgi:hypothetical protein